MRCKMCGAKLKKEGNLCRNCYQKMKKEKDLKAENEEVVFRLKRKYSPKFNLLKNGEILLFVIIIILAAFSSFDTWLAILVMILCIILFGVWMFYNKIRAKGTEIIFYETKLRYKAKYPLVDKEENIAYEDIKDIAYFQTTSQKLCKIGDIRFYTKGFLSGITVHDIPEVKENIEKIREIINASR